MPSLIRIWNCMFSPRLLKIYGNGAVDKIYEPTVFEKFGDQVISSLYIAWKISIYASPLVVGFLYNRDYFTSEGLVSLTKFVTSLGVILVISYCIRGLGRASNPTYINFLSALNSVDGNLTTSTKQRIATYDFDFVAWPLEFSHYKTKDDDKPYVAIEKPARGTTGWEGLMNIPFRIAAAVAIHTFGIRLVYPGSLTILRLLLEKALLQGRSHLIEHYRGERYKIKTLDGNYIDSMFVDRRNRTLAGSTLVICCEGNAGFYEIGIMMSALDAGYSVLGWNHPGFGASTGTPYPNQEQNAVDCIMQFAITKLGFKVENIVLFGWSIGGYSATWAAMNYPDVKGVILDATFDDILPLAKTHMPSWLEPIVEIAIRDHVNLHVSEQLEKYPGPVLLIRRSADEVICTRMNDLGSNRGNDLLITFLWRRYPFIFENVQVDLLKDYLSVTGNNQDQIVQKYQVNDDVCYSLLQSYVSEYSKTFPLKIGEDYNIEEKNKMALYLAKNHIKDFNATHCINLPSEMFQMPWEVHVESDYVFT